MLSVVSSYAIFGIEAIEIRVEVNITQGVNFFMVGLPDSAVKESHHRIYSAFLESGLTFPHQAITINLAPADIKKEGSMFDLPIAAGILASSGQIPAGNLEGYSLAGELSLKGELRRVRGVLPMAYQAMSSGKKGLIVPLENAEDLGLIKDFEIIPCATLKEVVDFFRTGKRKIFERKEKENFLNDSTGGKDFSEVYGQESVKRAVEIAAAGGHHILLSGPPGSGKSMICSRIPSILPPMTLEEAIQTSVIYNVSHHIRKNPFERPFRAPHHTISDVALVGGGSVPRPGEISLAHNGVLFLDELTEFKRSTLEVLRQPLEEKKVLISRSRFQISFPADFMLVAGMNPCPCGYHTHPKRPCTCSPGAVEKYLRKLSGPLIDRFDLMMEVLPVDIYEIQFRKKGESSLDISRRVEECRKIQQERFKGTDIRTNAGMRSRELEKYCVLDKQGLQLLTIAAEKMQLSARAYQKILRVARTIADLDRKENIGPEHVAEAIQYRSPDESRFMVREETIV